MSSAVAPDAALVELLDACARRGLGALELRAGDWHGVDRADDPLGAAIAAERALESGVVISAYVADEGGSDLRLARLSEALSAPVLVSATTNVHTAIERAAGLAGVGARAGLVLSGNESDEELDLVLATTFEIAWHAHPADGPLGTRGARLLERCGARLRHIRLVGGGPESATQEGHGIGELMGRLAVTGFDGSVVLLPSSPRFRIVWEQWLGRRGGWGCGSKQEDATLVGLFAQPATMRGRAE